MVIEYGSTRPGAEDAVADGRHAAAWLTGDDEFPQGEFFSGELRVRLTSLTQVQGVGGGAADHTDAMIKHEPEPGEIIETVCGFLPQLSAQSCTLAIENHDRLSARVLAEIIIAINSPFVGLCLDTANSIGAGEGLETVLHHLAKHTVCLHLKDIQMRRVSHLMGFDAFGCEPGTGIVDFKATYAAMGKHCQSVILEQWPPEASVEEAWATIGIQQLKALERRRM